MATRSKQVLGFLMFALTMFLSSTFQNWVPVCLAASITALVVLLRHKKATTGMRLKQPSSGVSRWLGWFGWTFGVLLILAVTGVWRWASQVGTIVNPIYVGTDILAHACLFWAFFVWAMRPNRAHLSMLPLGLMVLLFCVAAGGASRSLAAQTTVALASCVGFSLASQIILGSKRGTEGALFSSDDSPLRGTSWLGGILSMLTLSVLMMATSLVANATDDVLPGVQKLLRDQLRASLDAVNDESFIGGTGYVQGSKLGEIRRHHLQDPTGIALWVRSDYKPGYLRGSVFEVYRRRKWFDAGTYGTESLQQIASFQDRDVSPAGTGTAKLAYPRRQPLLRFPVTGDQVRQVIPLEIMNDRMKGPVFFTPLTTHWIEAKSSEVTISSDHTIRSGIDTTAPYVAGVGWAPIPEPLDQERRAVMLDVPSYLKESVQSVAGEVFRGDLDAQEKAVALANYFQDQYSYSLSLPKVPRDIDPLANFLRTKHPAHCEYFAASTALILRGAGVPTRYVTGYVVDELDAEANDDRSWLARNAGAHAWVEAYDDETNTWFAVETTPGRDYATVDPNAINTAAESLFDVFGNGDDDDDRTLIGRAVGWLFSIRATEPLLVLFRIAQLPLFCFLVFVLWTRYLRPQRMEIDPTDLRSRKMLRNADRRLRKYSLIRRPHETIYQFAARIEQHQSDAKASSEVMGDFARWYRQYADARYQGEVPSPLVS
ncbi:MAG: transglutaminase-like domain-containing protein [Rubripirellula sp.]